MPDAVGDSADVAPRKRFGGFGRIWCQAVNREFTIHCLTPTQQRRNTLTTVVAAISTRGRQPMSEGYS